MENFLKNKKTNKYTLIFINFQTKKCNILKNKVATCVVYMLFVVVDVIF